jgi:hypothetical protein
MSFSWATVMSLSIGDPVGFAFGEICGINSAGRPSPERNITQHRAWFINKNGMPMSEREASAKSDVRTAKEWFAYCLKVAVACVTASVIAWLAISSVHANYGAAICLLVLAFLLAIIGAVFSLLALTGVIDWFLMRKHQ